MFKQACQSVFLSTAVLAVAALGAEDFINFESAPVHPVALAPDGRTLAICNLPDGRVELFAEALMDIQNYPRSECVRTRRWKYIRYFRRKEDPAQKMCKFRGTLDDYRTCLDATVFGREPPIHEELFDLLEDPHEERNRIHDTGLTKEIRHFRERILSLGSGLKKDGAPPDTWEYDNRL